MHNMLTDAKVALLKTFCCKGRDLKGSRLGYETRPQKVGWFVFVYQPLGACNTSSKLFFPL